MTVFYNRIMRNQPVAIYEGGTPLRDFVHVSDVVRANLLAIDKDVEKGLCINVGSGQSYTILETAEAVARACGRDANLVDCGEFRIGDIHACVAGLAQARKYLDYVPRVSLRDGLKEFIEWAGRG
jgi:dTDP-L-rhamnose 4-epimerase